MKQRRLIVIGGGLIIVLLIWMFTHQSEKDVLQTHHISGVIKEFHTKKPPQKSSTPGHRINQIAIAVVELQADNIAEDGHARIMVPRDKYVEGDVIPLVLKLYKDGSKKVELTTQANSVTKKGD